MPRSLCVFNVLWWLFPRLAPRKVVACHRLDGLSTARSSGWTQHWSGPSSTSLDVVPWLRILADFDFFQRQRTSCGSSSVSSAKSCSATASLSEMNLQLMRHVISSVSTMRKESTAVALAEMWRAQPRSFASLRVGMWAVSRCTIVWQWQRIFKSIDNESSLDCLKFGWEV